MSNFMNYILNPSQIEEIISQINNGEILYKDLPLNQKYNRHIVITAVKKDIYNMRLIPERFYDDYYVMLELVKYNGLLLEYASEELIQDKNLVLEAVRQNGLALQFVFNYEIVYEDSYSYTDGYDSDGPCRFYEPGSIIDDSWQNLIDNEEIVLTAISQNVDASKFISLRLQQDSEIAKLIIK